MKLRDHCRPERDVQRATDVLVHLLHQASICFDRLVNNGIVGPSLGLHARRSVKRGGGPKPFWIASRLNSATGVKKVVAHHVVGRMACTWVTPFPFQPTHASLHGHPKAPRVTREQFWVVASAGLPSVLPVNIVPWKAENEWSNLMMGVRIRSDESDPWNISDGILRMGWV